MEQGKSTHSKKIIAVVIAAVVLIVVIVALLAGSRARSGAGSRYSVRLVDEDGKAVTEGKINFLSPDSRITVDVDDEGIASIPADRSSYGVQLASIPDTYENDLQQTYQVNSDNREITITLQNKYASAFQFSTTDINGNAVSSEDFKDAKVILVNYWEPWCGPCVQEMPELSELYEKYKDEGLVILGIYSDQGDDAEKIVSDNQIAYPILHSNGDLMKYSTTYFPTSYIVDGNGKFLSSGAIIGALGYDEWEEMVLPYLEGGEQ